MKKIFLLLTLGLITNVVLAQSTNNIKEKVKTEQKQAPIEKSKCEMTDKSSVKVKNKSCEKSIKKGCCSKKATEKKISSETSTCAKKSAKSEKSYDTSKCSKLDKCCTKTGKKLADCDKKDKGCCSGV